MTRISDSYLTVVEVTSEQSVTEDEGLIKGRWGEDCLDHREAALKQRECSRKDFRSS